MMRNRRIEHSFVALLLSLVLAVSAGGCGRRRETMSWSVTTRQITPASGRDSTSRIVVLTASALTTLDPYYMVSIDPEDSIAAHLWDTLVWLNNDLELEPRLAESWSLVNNFTWQLELRQGVTFHNGEPFDAQAVKFSLERTRQIENSLETFAQDVTLESVEIIDDYTVRIHTANPAVSTIYELSTVEMLPPTYYSQTDMKDLARNPVGSGPYRLVSWDPGGSVVLDSDADYWLGAATIDTLVFQTEPDVGTRLTRLADGDADLITDLPLDRAEAASTRDTRLSAIESTRRLFIGLRIDDGSPLADKRVRQALNYAVDVQALIAEFHGGHGQRYGSWVNPPHANISLSPWPYDPQKARDLLAQAGYPDGFEITMDTPVGRYYRDREIAEAIAAQLAKVGIKVTVQPWEWSIYVRERLVPKKTAPLFLLSLASRGNALEDTRNLAYDFPFNPTLWYDKDFQDLISQAQGQFDQALRLNLLQQAQAIAYEEAPWIWLWRPFLLYGVGKDLDWWQPRADGLIYLYTPAPGE